MNRDGIASDTGRKPAAVLLRDELVANVVLDKLDWELDRRGRRFARYADDCNVVVKSYRELRRRGVSVREAWNTGKSAHGPWRLSKTPALALALPVRHFSQMGLPCLVGR